VSLPKQEKRRRHAAGTEAELAVSGPNDGGAPLPADLPGVAREAFLRLLEFVDRGEWRSAYESVDALLEEFPRARTLAVYRAYIVGSSLSRCGHASRSEREFRKALAMDPFFEPARAAMRTRHKRSLWRRITRSG